MITETVKISGTNLYPENLFLSYGEHELALDVPEGVWNPTPHGNFLAKQILNLDFEGADVLELGSGCGNHTILIARKNPKSLTVTEIEDHILDNTRHNLEKHGVNMPVEYICTDWTQVNKGPFDILITNPPFTKSGKKYYRYFIDTLINDAHKLVKPGGRLIFIQSSMANVPRSIALMKEWDMNVRVVAQEFNPFRDYYYEDERYMRMINSFPGAFFMHNGTHHEMLTVFEATLPKD